MDRASWFLGVFVGVWTLERFTRVAQNGAWSTHGVKG